MSNSLLYHAFGIRDVEYIKSEYRWKEIVFHIQTKKEKLHCSNCRSKNVIKKGQIEREFRTYPIGMKSVILHVYIHRLECKDCGKIRQENISYAFEKKVTRIVSLGMSLPYSNI